ncbi:9942_t:CDS:1, partial [Dentiscutata erythropus]
NFPVLVPMLIEETWENCYIKTYKKYKEAKAQKDRIKILAYSYHLGSLVLACPNILLLKLIEKAENLG